MAETKQCPICRIELKAKVIGPVEVEECRRCHGTWFETDELKRAKDATDEDLHWLDFEIWKHADQFESKASPRECPAGHEAMVSLRYGKTSVEIDFCKSCRGTWLDEGEFEKIIASLEEEVLAKSFSDYVKESLEEAREIVTGPESFLSEWKDFSTVLRLMQNRLFVEHPKLLQTILAAQKGPFR